MVNKNSKGVLDMNEGPNKSEAFFIKYKKAIIIAIAILILIIAGISLYKAYISGPRENKASTELAKAQEYFNMEQFDAYSSADDAMVSPAAEAALGNAYAHVNQLDKAVSCLKKAAKMADSELKEGVNNSLSPTFLLQAGQILESQGKYADALKLYQDIKKTYVGAALVQSGDIEKYIERASLK